MSKWFFISLNALAVLVMTGCGKQTDSQPENFPSAREQSASRGNTNPAIVSRPMNMAESNNQSVQSAPKLATPITEKEAVELAKKTVAGAIQIQSDTKVTVEKTNEQIVVTFGGPPPSGVRGADYDAKVIINPNTGKVEKWLVGP